MYIRFFFDKLIGKNIKTEITNKIIEISLNPEKLNINNKVNKILNIKQVNVKTCLVEIPNEEIKRLFESIIELWFLNKAACADLQDLLSDLINGKFDEFEYKFQRLVIEMFSYMDVGIDTAENFYHAFVLGLLVGLKDTHTVVSNRESGYGRYDIMVKPKDKNHIAFIMEFKVDKFDKIKDLDTIIESAFNQIEEKKYETELRNEGYTNISKMAYSFKGKDCKMAIR